MKNIIRATVMSLAVSIIATLYFASPLSQIASAAGCWYGCTDGAQRSRRGCSVRYAGTVGDGAIGHYVYTCDGQEISCFYKYECDSEVPIEEGPES